MPDKVDITLQNLYRTIRFFRHMTIHHAAEIIECMNEHQMDELVDILERLSDKFAE